MARSRDDQRPAQPEIPFPESAAERTARPESQRERGPRQLYELRDSELQALADIGTFRSLAIKDFAEFRYAGDNAKANAELRNLVQQGLLRVRKLHPSKATFAALIHTRLHSKRRVHTKLGVQLRDTIRPVTVHQEYRVLRRLLNVAVKKRVLSASPCDSVEFPMLLLSATRKPHYMTSNEQRKIEFFAPDYLRRIVTIISEMGLRPQKELFPMLKSQVDISNGVVHIPDSKTSSGVADMPMTPLAKQAFQEQIEATPTSDHLFPSPSLHATKPHISKVARTWRTTLRLAAVTYFPLYHLRHTFATRLSAGGVADNFVTQMLRQGDAQVFKRYSQAKLNMMRESIEKLDRQAYEHRENSGTPVVK